MAGGVVNGQDVDEVVTNPAFIFKNADDFTVHKIGLKDTDVASGPILYNNIQRALNTLDTATGCDEGTPATTYSGPTNTVLDGDTYQTAIGKLAQKFNQSTGHSHKVGIEGEGAPIAAVDLANVPFRGFVIQGVDITGVTGSSSDISTQFSTKQVSTNTTTLGVVTNSPQNKVVIRNADNDDQYEDTLGNEVYGRITNTGGVGGTWTLSYFVDIAGVETAYSFLSSSNVRFYYQELFNPMNNPPVYSEFAVIPSDNATADVNVATQTEYGKVILQNSVSQPIGTTGSAGTANGRVANEDHVHAGSGFARARFTATLADNTASPTDIQTFDKSLVKALIITYHLDRGTANARTGTFTINVNSDASLSSYFDETVDVGSLGITFSADTAGSAGAEIRFRFTSTNTGTAGSLIYETTIIA